MLTCGGLCVINLLNSSGAKTSVFFVLEHFLATYSMTMTRTIELVEIPIVSRIFVIMEDTK